MNPIFSAIWGFLKAIPWWLYVAAGLVVFHFADRSLYARRQVAAATAEVNKSWQDRETKMLQKAADELAKANADARAREAAWQKEMDDVQAGYQKQLADAKARHDRDVAAALAGTLKLRVPSSVCADYSPSGKASSPSPGSDGAATVELPREITSDLFALADDADQVADQLRSCQQVVLNYLKGNP